LEKNKLLKLDGEAPFDYLIRSTFYSVTKEKVDELNKLLESKNKFYGELKKTSIEDLWVRDLKVLEKNYI
jgi:hypothetical protein